MNFDILVNLMFYCKITINREQFFQTTNRGSSTDDETEDQESTDAETLQLFTEPDMPNPPYKETTFDNLKGAL